MADRILEGTGKMQRMIEDVLQYSKAGQANIAKKAVNMQQLLTDLRQDLLVSSPNAELKIEIQNTPGLIGNKMMILEVFSNLVGNAVKYSGKTASPVVSITGEQLDQSTVRYTVADNGIGSAGTEQEVYLKSSPEQVI